MNRILISIKPEYVKQILNGSKKYEYRKILPQKNVCSLIIYSTWPIMEIVGEVEIIEILEMTPASLWDKTNKDAGISKDKYLEYFKNREKAFAYVLGRVTKYDSNKKLSDIGIQQAPQSFVYLTSEQYALLQEDR